jgi:hypothetical protein
LGTGFCVAVSRRFGDWFGSSNIKRDFLRGEPAEPTLGEFYREGKTVTIIVTLGSPPMSGACIRHLVDDVYKVIRFVGDSLFPGGIRPELEYLLPSQQPDYDER